MNVSLPAHAQETIRLATLALSRLSSKFDEQALKEQQIESEFFQRALGKDNFDNFDHMLNYVQEGLNKFKNFNKDVQMPSIS